MTGWVYNKMTHFKYVDFIYYKSTWSVKTSRKCMLKNFVLKIVV